MIELVKLKKMVFKEAVFVRRNKAMWEDFKRNQYTIKYGSRNMELRT